MKKVIPQAEPTYTIRQVKHSTGEEGISGNCRFWVSHIHTLKIVPEGDRPPYYVHVDNLEWEYIDDLK